MHRQALKAGRDLEEVKIASNVSGIFRCIKLIINKEILMPLSLIGAKFGGIVHCHQ
jgi:hypothetical protein